MRSTIPRTLVAMAAVGATLGACSANPRPAAPVATATADAADAFAPTPAAACPCANEERCATSDTRWVATLAGHRFRPEWPWTPPDDAAYGEWKQLCLAPALYQGGSAAKLAAVRSYASQLGTLARSGTHAPGLSGIMDCNGYLTSFLRRTEPFVMVAGGR